MANNLDSNITRKVARVFLKEFESSRVLTKTVNSQLLSGVFNPSSGDKVDFKRSHQYNSISTPDGDISLSTKSDIISGKATGTVQNFLTGATEFGALEQAIELDQMEEILAPMARRLVTDLELSLGQFMIKNSGLSSGVVGTVADAWSDVAGTGALMKSVGVPSDSPWYYVMNPFTSQGLADAQNSLTAADGLVRTAWEDAQISRNFGGLRGISSNALSSYTTGAGADRTGTLAATPDSTYVTHKDSMQQTLSLTGLDAVLPIKAGDVIEFTGTGALARSRLNVDTREIAFNELGSAIPWRCTVLADAVAVAGAATVTVSAAALSEANGQYNNISTALLIGDVFTILGAESTTFQPNLFYHPQAFGIGTVKLPKLFSTDTIATTSDGFSIRVSKYADGDANTQKIRFDLVPAFAVFNPLFAGTGWGK